MASGNSSPPRKSTSKKSTSSKKPSSRKPVDLDDFKAVRRAYNRYNDMDTATSFVRSMDLVADSKDGTDTENYMDKLINERALASSSSSSSADESTSQGKTKTFSVSATTYASLKPALKSDRVKQMSINPSSLFVDTDVQLKENSKYSPNPGRVVAFSDFFSVNGMDGKTAEIIIVSGEGGTGKTMLLKYILQKFSDQENHPIKDLDSGTLMFFTELREQKYGNFANLAVDLLQRSMESKLLLPGQDIMSIVLSLPILVVLDGFDDSIGVGSQLCREVVQMHGINTKVVITCRPQYVDTLYSFIPKRRRKRTTHLTMNSIPPSHYGAFVNNYIDTQVSLQGNEFAKKLIKKSLIRRLPEIQRAIGDDFGNPLMLTMITRMWFEHPVLELGF